MTAPDDKICWRYKVAWSWIVLPLFLLLLLDDGATEDNAVANSLPEHHSTRLSLEGHLTASHTPFPLSDKLNLARDRLDGQRLHGLHLVVGHGGDPQLGLLLLLLEALLVVQVHSGGLGWRLHRASMSPTVGHGWQGLEMAIARVVVADPTPILVVADVERVAGGKVLSLEAGVVVSLRDDARLYGVLVDSLHGWQADHWIVEPVLVPRTAGGVNHLPFLLRAGHDDLEALLLPPVQGLLGHGQLCQTGWPAETGHLGLVIRLLSLTSGITESFLWGERAPGPPESPGAGLGTCSSSPEREAGSQAEGSVLGVGAATLLTASWQQPVLLIGDSRPFRYKLCFEQLPLIAKGET